MFELIDGPRNSEQRVSLSNLATPPPPPQSFIYQVLLALLDIRRIYLYTVVGKLLLKSNCVTLLPLLVKETSYFESVTHFSM